jgi:ankyrin repeat protein
VTDSTLSAVRQWPSRPDFDQFRRQAKELLKACRSGDAHAVAEVQRHEQAPDPAAFALHDAQRVLARSYGFPSWQKLKSYVQAIQPYWRPLEPKSDDDANRFLRLACITYFDGDHPSRRVKARQLLAEKPQLARANIYTAAAVGDVAAVADFLAKNAQVRAKGGPFNWEPLLYAAYSRLDSEAEEHSTLEAARCRVAELVRVPSAASVDRNSHEFRYSEADGHSTLEGARLLLAHGADRNAGFLWEGGFLFTALTGVLGLGEDDVGRGEGPLSQPPHSHWREFARLLLEAGADPNDNQGLYNRMQYPDDEHLRLLFEYGLGKDQGGPWFKRFFQHWPYASAPRSPSDILAYQLRWAISANYFDRVKLLVENGADVNARSPYPAGARAPYAEAVYHGHQEIADYLVARGAMRIAGTLGAGPPLTPPYEGGEKGATGIAGTLSAGPPLTPPYEGGEKGATGIALTTAEEFHAACCRSDADRARELVASDPSLLDDAGRLLIRAAEAGRVDTLRLLVELGAHVNGKPGDESPLHCAARAGQLDAVKLLVELGADVHARDRNFDGTPLSFANYKGQRDVALYLLQFARIWDAVKVGGLDRVRALMRESPDCVNVRDHVGRTPLHYPFRDTQHGEEIIELLLEHGADMNARDDAGRTPIDQMLQNGRQDLAAVLRRHGGESA